MQKLLILTVLLVIVSCSVQKRKYMSGYHVDWHLNKNKPGNKPSPNLAMNEENGQLAVHIQNNIEPVNTSVSNDITTGIPLRQKPKSIFDDPCDVIFFRDGTELSARVTEITSTQIKYKACDNPEGPTYVVEKSKLFMIKYANGTKEVFSAPVGSTQSSTQAPAQVYHSKETNTLAGLGLAFSILGFYPLILIGSIIGLICSAIALNQINRNPERYSGKGIAQAGIIVGMAGIFIMVIIIMALLLA